MTDLERRLAELAAYHVGLFTGVATGIGASPAEIAHALFLLARRRPGGAGSNGSRPKSP